MATARTYRTGDRQPSRWKRNVVLLVLAAVALAIGVSWQGLRAEALVATSYAARVGCVCRYVSGREMSSCKSAVAVANLGRSSGLITYSLDEEARTLRASVPLLASQTATFAPDRGCQLEPWRH